jgi:hypothetical protein
VANRLYFRERRAGGKAPRSAAVVSVAAPEPGPVEAGVEAEIHALTQAEARPGLTQTALALARIMDNPRAVNQQAAAAKVLAVLLDKLRSASARHRRGGLALVRAMTSGDDTAGA